MLAVHTPFLNKYNKKKKVEGNKAGGKREGVQSQTQITIDANNDEIYSKSKKTHTQQQKAPIHAVHM